MNHPQSPLPDVPSPCVGVCSLDSRRICTGCQRTIDEIGEWPRADRLRKIEIRRLAELRRSLSSLQTKTE